MIKGFNHSIRGFSHERLNKPLQDASGYKITDKFAIVSVADGHGGEIYFRSDRGSKFAVECAIEKLTEFCSSDEYCDLLIKEKEISIINQINSSIIYLWQQKVKEDFNKFELSDRELEIINNNSLGKTADSNENILCYYGTTLLYGCMAENFSIISQIGDGKSAIYTIDNKIRYPLKEDDRLCFGFTTSISSNNAISDFRNYILFDNINGIVLATDGVVDSYSENSFGEFLKSVLSNYMIDNDKTDSELCSWLKTISTYGSHDDVSVAGIYKTNNFGTDNE